MKFYLGTHVLNHMEKKRCAECKSKVAPTSKNCANCLGYALEWRESIISQIDSRVV